MRPRWPQDGLKLGQDELRWANIGTRWPKMGKMSDKITQDGGKMRKMRDVSSGLPTLGGHGTAQPANNPASRGPGEGQEGYKVAHEGAKRAPRQSQMAPR